MLESQRTLYTSNLFRLASILPPTGDSVKRIEIQVVEAPLHDARIGAGCDNVNFVALEAQLLRAQFARRRAPARHHRQCRRISVARTCTITRLF